MKLYSENVSATSIMQNETMVLKENQENNQDTKNFNNMFYNVI